MGDFSLDQLDHNNNSKCSKSVNFDAYNSVEWGIYSKTTINVLAYQFSAPISCNDTMISLLPGGRGAFF